ncbi:ABC transporter permease [Desulfurococcaceae archaeon MEX13E-LK6-19]|nr:ABC transporter permease [Desulfurococcaceae archaeon MEX13E-LK6-19]
MNIAEILLDTAPVFIMFYLTALGHGFFEKSGVLNLAIDGLFILSAATAFAAAVYSGNPWIGVATAAVVAALFGAFLAYITTKLPISHGAAGLSLMFLGYGLALTIGDPAYSYVSVHGIRGYNITPVGIVPVLMYVIPIAIGVLLLYVLNYTKLGAAIRAAGENPHAAAALGVDVLGVRIIAGLIGYALIGAGGAFFVLSYVGSWNPKLYYLGYGWIAFAISLSAGRHPLLTALNAGIFAGLINYQFTILALYGLPTDVAKMLPFIAAILAMVIFNVTPLRRKLAPPASLGKIYFKEEKTV